MDGFGSGAIALVRSVAIVLRRVTLSLGVRQAELHPVLVQYTIRKVLQAARLLRPYRHESGENLTGGPRSLSPFRLARLTKVCNSLVGYF